MISSFVRALVSAFKARRELALKNVALRQQLAVLPRSVKRLRLSNVDREFWHRTRWRTARTPCAILIAKVGLPQALRSRFTTSTTRTSARIKRPNMSPGLIPVSAAASSVSAEDSAISSTDSGAESAISPAASAASPSGVGYRFRFLHGLRFLRGDGVGETLCLLFIHPPRDESARQTTKSCRHGAGRLPWCINTGKSLIPLTLLFLHQKRNLLIPLELSRVMHQGSHDLPHFVP